MKKILLFLILLLSPFYGEDYFYSVIDKIEISEDFKNYKQLDRSLYLNKKIRQISVKITLNEEKIKKQTFYLSVVSDINSLVYTNIKYVHHKNIMHIKLDDLKSNIIYFNYSYDEPKISEFRCDVINDFEYKYLYPNEGILYGVAYGIIFCAFLYYLVIYISSNRKCFLYYSLMQLFVLLSLIGFTYVSFLAYPNQEFYLTQGLIDIFETSSFLFTLLFVKEILNTKKIMPKMHMVLNFFILLNILDIFAILYYKYSILYEYIPFSIVFLISGIAGIIASYRKNKFAPIYTIGWFSMFIFVYFAEKQIISISGIYTIHMAAPIESLIFSFALALMLRQLITEQNEKEKLLIHKEKLASMGKMINNIAHQWRQPLTHLSFINMNLQMASMEELSKEFINEKVEESNEQIEFMSNTIDSFRDFYKPQKDKEKFYLSKAVYQAVDIMSVLLEKENIEIEVDIRKDKKIYSYENEYSQVILNLITNAKDVLVEREIQNPKINITVDCYSLKSFTAVCDNAEGIKESDLEKVFEPYFTTKEKGSGIGLYMSKTIIESHFKGKLKVENKEIGACFTIEV